MRESEYGVKVGSISGWVAEQTGYSVRQVQDYLDSKYKSEDKARAGALGGAMTASKSAIPNDSIEMDAIDQLGITEYEQLEKHPF